MQKQIDLGDILEEYGEQYITQNKCTNQEKGLIRLLASCRSSALGSHYRQCNHCSYVEKAYNSCRNRHCPECQQIDKLEWLNKRMEELLPTGYYHLVFTIPSELNSLCLANKKIMYTILFKAASETILELTKDPKHLGADTGIIAVIHTWGQNLMEHPHLHCIVPSGGMSFDKSHWVNNRHKDDFFVHYKVISRLFRGKFLDFMYQAAKSGQLENISEKYIYELRNRLSKIDWVVNIQSPFGSARKVLEYLSRYVFRVAISNRRIEKIEDSKVYFTWKDYRSGHFRKMKLDVNEFIRRFLLHVLPKGFFKVRYYGIFSNRYRRENIIKSRQLLAEEKQQQYEEAIEDGLCVNKKQNLVWEELLQLIENFRKPNCPHCKKGHLRFAGIVPAEKLMPG